MVLDMSNLMPVMGIGMFCCYMYQVYMCYVSCRACEQESMAAWNGPHVDMSCMCA